MRNAFSLLIELIRVSSQLESTTIQGMGVAWGGVTDGRGSKDIGHTVLFFVFFFMTHTVHVRKLRRQLNVKENVVSKHLNRNQSSRVGGNKTPLCLY